MLTGHRHYKFISCKLRAVLGDVSCTCSLPDARCLTAAEFQKIPDHNGMVWNCWTGALAHLGLARANALQLRMSQGADVDAARVRALIAYEDYFALWKDGDADVPILEQAKAEYATLQ